MNTSASSPSAYEAVIGLEVHVQLKTRSKMFTRVATGFGEPPNTLTDPVVLALPGTLPVMNKEALDKIIKTGLLLGCEIAPVCKWDRKNYFYPDSPKNYQISQYDQPICLRGGVEIELPGSARNVMGEHKIIPLTRIHLEEDVGKLNHGAVESLIDYNRAGTPLMELVTDPALKSADEAFAFLTAFRMVLVAAGISDCDMEKGQMRCDANISIRPVGQKELGTKVELKNLNSISFVRDGIMHEIQRQIAVVLGGGTIRQETRDYDGQTGTSQSLRSKEMAHDYRYFPDPDLMPVKVDEAWKAQLREGLPELPFDKQRRLMRMYGLPYTITSVLIPHPELCRFFEETLVEFAKAKPSSAASSVLTNTPLPVNIPPAGVHPGVLASSPSSATLTGSGDVLLAMRAQATGNWIANDLLRELGAAGIELAASKVRPAHIAALVGLVEGGAISSSSAKEVFAEMFQSGEMPEPIVDRRGLRQSNDTGELEKWCQDAIAGNPKAVAEYKSGNEKAINSLKGPVMKAGKGKANPKLVDEVLRKLLAAG